MARSDCDYDVLGAGLDANENDAEWSADVADADVADVDFAYVKVAHVDVADENVAQVVERYQVPLPLELPEEERTGDGDNLIDPFPAADMGLDHSEYSGALSTDSEESDTNHEDFHKDSQGRRPEDVFALASVELQDVAEQRAARAERKKQARVTTGKAEDDSEGEEDSEDQSSEDESEEESEDESEDEDEGSEKLPDARSAAKK